MYMDNWRPGGTGWMDLYLVGQQSGARLHLFRLCQLRTVRCMDPGQVTDFVPSIYLLMGGGKTCFSLVMGSGSFRTCFLGGYIYWVEEV
jgi:hypothetical protein